MNKNKFLLMVAKAAKNPAMAELVEAMADSTVNQIKLVHILSFTPTGADERVLRSVYIRRALIEIIISYNEEVDDRVCLDILQTILDDPSLL